MALERGSASSRPSAHRARTYEPIKPEREHAVVAPPPFHTTLEFSFSAPESPLSVAAVPIPVQLSADQHLLQTSPRANQPVGTASSNTPPSAWQPSSPNPAPPTAARGVPNSTTPAARPAPMCIQSPAGAQWRPVDSAQVTAAIADILAPPPSPPAAATRPPAPGVDTATGGFSPSPFCRFPSSQRGITGPDGTAIPSSAMPAAARPQRGGSPAVSSFSMRRSGGGGSQELSVLVGMQAGMAGAGGSRNLGGAGPPAGSFGSTGSGALSPTGTTRTQVLNTLSSATRAQSNGGESPAAPGATRTLARAESTLRAYSSGAVAPAPLSRVGSQTHIAQSVQSNGDASPTALRSLPRTGSMPRHTTESYGALSPSSGGITAGPAPLSPILNRILSVKGMAQAITRTASKTRATSPLRTSIITVQSGGGSRPGLPSSPLPTSSKALPVRMGSCSAMREDEERGSGGSSGGGGGGSGGGGGGGTPHSSSISDMAGFEVGLAWGGASDRSSDSSNRQLQRNTSLSGARRINVASLIIPGVPPLAPGGRPPLSHGQAGHGASGPVPPGWQSASPGQAGHGTLGSWQSVSPGGQAERWSSQGAHQLLLANVLNGQQSPCAAPSESGASPQPSGAASPWTLMTPQPLTTSSPPSVAPLPSPHATGNASPCSPVPPESPLVQQVAGKQQQHQQRHSPMVLMDYGTAMLQALQPAGMPAQQAVPPQPNTDWSGTKRPSGVAAASPTGTRNVLSAAASPTGLKNVLSTAEAGSVRSSYAHLNGVLGTGSWQQQLVPGFNASLTRATPDAAHFKRKAAVRNAQEARDKALR